MLAAAPVTVHLGMRDRGWLVGHPPAERRTQLVLELAALAGAELAA